MTPPASVAPTNVVDRVAVRRAFLLAQRDAALDHLAHGDPMWQERDGQVVAVPAEQVLRETDALLEALGEQVRD
jgi:hypothetical protein